MRIQNIEFERGETIISVGFFRAKDIEVLFRHAPPKHLMAFEPNQRAFAAYSKLSKRKSLTIEQMAVGGHYGVATLTDCSTRSTIRKITNSNKRQYEVGVVSMESVLETQSVVDKLLINCEGSEIDIIDNTLLRLFEKCSFIFVQFHTFMPQLNITKDDVTRCIEKLGKSYNWRCRNRKYGKYDFRRMQ